MCLFFCTIKLLHLLKLLHLAVFLHLPLTAPVYVRRLLHLAFLHLPAFLHLATYVAMQSKKGNIISAHFTSQVHVSGHNYTSFCISFAGQYGALVTNANRHVYTNL